MSESGSQRDVAFGGVPFITTHWSAVVVAGGEHSPAAAAALEELCHAYWYPLYAFVRRQGHSPEDAQDLTQGFYARVLEKNYMAQAQREKGKFRCFLLASLKHFLADEWDKTRAQKRGGGEPVLSLDASAGEDRYRLEPVENTDAEKLFERRWALTVLEQAREQLKTDYSKAGKSGLYQHLSAFESGDSDAPPYAEVAAQSGLSESSVKSAVFRLRRRYRELVREEISKIVKTPAEIDEEIRYLIGVIRG